MRKVAFEISDNSIQASSSYAGPSVLRTNTTLSLQKMLILYYRSHVLFVPLPIK